MRFVEEVVVDEFLPTVRAMLAEDLRERGLTQSEVAEALGISQSAVSKYAHGDVERNEAVAADERVREVVDEVGEGLATGDVSPVQALVEIEVLIRRLEHGDLIRRLHEEAFPPLSEYGGDFRVHDPDSELRASERVLSSLRRALRALESAGGFADLLPNVGSNLVACVPDPEGIEDVAGVPGRIFAVKGRAEIPGDPEFGVSEHVASVLLAARDAGSDATAAINLRYDGAVIDRLREEGRTVAEFDPERDVEDAIGDAMAEAPDATALYHTGGFGIEPNVYLLGDDPSAVVGAVRALVRDR